MSSDGISISITEDVTKVEVTEDVTTINITPSVTTVEAKGISIANASAATAVTYQGLSNTLGTGGNVAASLDHINTNGFNKTLGGTVAGATDFTSTITFTGAADFNNTVSFTSNIDTDLALDSTKRITWGSTGGVQYKFIKGTDGANLELGTGTTTTMFISNNGNVGIGVAIPTSKLDVDGGITGTALDINGDGDISNELVVGTKVESPLFKGDLEGAVHFKASGSGLAKGDVVYISGYAGQRTTVAKADASDSAKMPAFGIVNATQGNNNVDVLTFGSMLHLSTTGIATGTELYVSASTPGGYETSAPTGEGNLIQKIAKVVRGDSNSGSIKIMGAGRTNATPNLNDGNIFIGNSSNIPTTASFDTTFGTSLATRTTTDLTEGDNEYYTSARADARVDLQTGSNLDLSQKTTTDLAEGDNEYYTDAKVGTYISGDRSYGNITTTGYLRGPSTFTIDPSGHGDNTGTVVIAGDLQVDGTTTTINSTELTIEDKVLTVAGSATTNLEAHGAGISFGATNTGIFYSSSRDGLRVFGDVQFLNDTTINAAIKTNSGDAGSAGQALLSTGTSWEWGDISTTLNVEADSGDTQAIEMLTENLDIAGGTGISTATTDNTVTVKLDDTAVAAGTYGAAKTIPQITVDGQGRITSATEITGQVGEPGGISLNKRFSTDAYNLAAFGFDLKLNSADVSLVTQAKISHDAFMIDPSNGTNITIDYESFLDDITTIDADCLGYFHIYKAGEPTTFATYKITAGSAFSGNNAYTLEHIASRIPGSETTFTDEEHIVLSYSRAGADGSTADVNTALGTSSASDNEVLSWTGSAFDWVPQSGGIALTDLSVTTETAGAAALTYSNATGVFTYTPPDLSSYSTLALGTSGTTALAGNASIGDLSDVDGTIATTENSILAYDSNTNKYTPHTVPGLQDDTKNQYIKVKAGGNGVFKGKPYCLFGYSTADNLPVTENTDADGAGQMLCAGFGIETASSGTETKLLVQGLLTNLDTTFNTTATISSISSSNVNATTGVITSDVAHNWEDGYKVYGTSWSDSGLLGLSSGSVYYVRSIPSNGFILFPTLNDALNNTNKITYTAAQVTAATGESFSFVANDSGTLLYPGTGAGTLRRQPPVRGLNVVAQHVAEIVRTHATEGVLYVNPGSPIERSQLQSGEVAYGGVNGEQKTSFRTLLKSSFPLKADMGYPSAPGGLVETDVISLTGAAGAKDEIVIGETVAQLDQITLKPGDSGVRIHRSTSALEGVNQTLIFHTTDNGIHVGNDRRGTYTAGDLMQNADLDFGMLVGRESVNDGSNNFGFGYKHTFAAGTSSNFATGSLHNCSTTGSSNNFMAGGDNKLSVSGSNNFCGGVRTDTRNSNNFTWAEGVVDGNTYYRAKNYGFNCALFGKQTEIDGNCTYSLVGGDVDGSYASTTLASSHECILWGEHQTMANSYSSISVGSNNIVRRVAGGTAAFGYSNVVGPSSGGNTFGMVVGGTINNVDSALSAVFGASNTVNTPGTSGNLVGGNDNTVEGSNNLCVGEESNSIGESAVCLGKNLKTPLFQPVVNINGTLTEQGDHVWDNYSTVVGAYNDEAHKYHTVYPTDGTVPTAWVTDHRFVVGTGTATNAKANGFIVALSDANFSGIIMPALAASTSHSSGSVAKAAGVPVGGLYHTNGVVKVVLTGD
tara:strand:- start:596 stop:5599 length:5004 start_codon:yes stop_codon:yes gene_type:complete